MSMAAWRLSRSTSSSAPKAAPAASRSHASSKHACRSSGSGEPPSSLARKKASAIWWTTRPRTSEPLGGSDPLNHPLNAFPPAALRDLRLADLDRFSLLHTKFLELIGDDVAHHLADKEHAIVGSGKQMLDSAELTIDWLTLQVLQGQFDGEVRLRLNLLGHLSHLLQVSGGFGGQRPRAPRYPIACAVVTRGFSVHRVAICFIGGVPVGLEFIRDFGIFRFGVFVIGGTATWLKAATASPSAPQTQGSTSLGK